MKTLLNLFFVFFKLGLFTFGGGYAMIPHIKEELVNKKKWLTENEMVEILAVAESTPGPIAINMATFIGHSKKGILGSLFATLGVILPSFIIIFIISLFFDKFMSNQYVQYAFIGIKCGVAFLIFKTGIEMLIKMKKNIFNVCALVVSLTLLVLFEIFAINVSVIFFILAGGIIGLIIFSILNKKKPTKGPSQKEDK